jgi:hypothetical protein
LKTSIDRHRRILKRLMICWASLHSSRGARASVRHPVSLRRLGTPRP